MDTPKLKATEPVKVWYEQNDDTHITRGLFYGLDETGLMLRAERVPVFSFIPRERVVLIEQVDTTGPVDV